MVHYLFLLWNLPWIILACYGNQQKKKKKKKQSIIPRSDAVVCDIWSGRTGLGIHLSNLGPTNHVDQNKKEEEENGCVQAVHSFITLSKATFDLLDTPTAPGCFAVSVYSHVSHKWIIIRLPLLMIRVNRLFTAQRSVKCWFFDNVWIMT